jgi:hypothetical protein
MSAINVRLPTSLHKGLRELAQKEGVSINQLLISAASEKLAALETEAYLEVRAKRGKRSTFERILANVPDVDPAEEDQLLDTKTRRIKPRAKRQVNSGA